MVIKELKDNTSKSDLQKKIINKIIEQLYITEPSLYYTATIELAGIIEEKIASKDQLTVQEYEMVQELKARDIQNLISYASSCC